MRAISLDAFGGNENLRLRDVPEPVPGASQIRIRLRAAGIAIWDVLVREGKFPIPMTPPFTPGFEGAGIVDAVGSDVRGVSIGDAVWTMSYASSGHWAEAVVVNDGEFGPKPDGFDFAQCCALGLASVTAYMGVIETLAPQRGETVLIAGAAGGVGTIALQLARHAGARVIATGGSANADYLRSLGADEVIDYTRGDVAAAIRAVAPGGVDAAFDCVNGMNARETVKAVRGGGRIAIVTPPDLEPDDRTIRVTRVQSAPSHERLAAVAALASKGALRVSIDRRFTLDTISAGLDYVANGHTRGKVVSDIA